jgi:hypothetical protein
VRARGYELARGRDPRAAARELRRLLA